MLYSIVLKNNLYFCIEFFMVLDFKVNARLVVGMTINFFCALELVHIHNEASWTFRGCGL